MRTAAVLLGAGLALASCASKEQIEGYAVEQCAAMKVRATPGEYALCLQQIRLRCEQLNNEGGVIVGRECRPR